MTKHAAAALERRISVEACERTVAPKRRIVSGFHVATPEKHGWVKLHLMVGAVTHVVTGVKVASAGS